MLRSGIRAVERDKRRRAAILILLAALIWMPMCFGPFTSISHIVFAATPGWIFWIGLAAAALLAGSIPGRRRGPAHPAPAPWAIPAGAAVLLWAGAIICGIPVHGHEAGVTPTLGTSPLHAATWVLSCATIIALAACLRAAAPRRGAYSTLAPAALLGLLLVSVAASL